MVVWRALKNDMNFCLVQGCSEAKRGDEAKGRPLLFAGSGCLPLAKINIKAHIVSVGYFLKLSL